MDQRQTINQKSTDRSDRIARHSLAIFLALFACSLLRYLYKIGMARMLNVRGYGILSTVEPFMILTTSLTLTGFASALSKYLSEEIAQGHNETAENYLATALYYLFPLSVGVSVIVYGFAGVIAETLFHEPELTILIRVIIVLMPVQAIWLIFDGVFLGHQESPYYTYSLIVFDVVTLVAAVFLVSRGMGPMGAILGALIGGLAGVLCAYYFYVTKFKEKVSISSGEKSVAIMKKLTNFAIPKTITSVSAIILMSFDIFCVTYFLGVTYTGLYNAAVPLARMMISVSMSIRLPLLPAVSEDAAREKTYIAKYLTDAVRYVSAVTLPLVILLIYYAERLITFFFGPEYSPAATALMILALAMLCMAYGSIFSAIFQGMDDPQTPMKITVVAVVLNIILNIYLIPKIGIEGAAFATLASMAFSLVSLGYKIRGFAKYKRIRSDLLRIGGLSACVFVIAVVFKDIFLVGIFVALAFYAAAIIKFNIVDIKKFLSSIEEV